MYSAQYLNYDYDYILFKFGDHLKIKTMVRAKFWCASVNDSESSTEEPKGKTITLNPVTSGSEENEQFYKMTPAGQVILTTVNEEAAASFEVGKEYFVDFTKVE